MNLIGSAVHHFKVAKRQAWNFVKTHLMEQEEDILVAVISVVAGGEGGFGFLVWWTLSTCLEEPLSTCLLRFERDINKFILLI